MRWLLVLALAHGSGHGELTHVGNKWSWAGTGEVFVPQLVMYATPPNFYGNPGKVDADIRSYLYTYGFHGFHVFVSCRWFDIGEPDCREADGRDPELDPRTFEALEMLIGKTHAAGGMVHIWMWGDEERGQTPSARSDWGGLDGPVARKVEAAIAERLGPLPGWTLGYGFDLDEWVGPAELRAWRDRMHTELPAFHFLGGRPAGPNSGSKHGRYAEWNRGVDYASYEHHKPSYAVYVDALEANPDKPVMSEDRFRVLHSTDRKHYSPQEIRRGLWHSTLAGGVANIWGHLIDGGSHELGSAPFPNRGQIRTHFEFMRGRFLAPMKRLSSPNANPRRESLCLGDPPAHYIFYKENTDRVELDLRSLERSLPVIAVDAKKPYEELDLGAYAAGRHGWRAPYVSDWAIAVGRFDRDEPGSTLESGGPSALAAKPGPGGSIELTWVDDAARRRRFELERARAEGPAPGPFQRIASLPAGQTRYTDRAASAGTTYWYRVRGVSAAGATAYTESIRVASGDGTTRIAELRPSSYQAVPLVVGERYYVDRTYTIASFPAALAGATLLKTGNEDKLERGERFASFVLSRPATIYVGFDRRADRIPYWLDEWAPAQGRISVEGDAMRYFDLYRRDFPAGAVELGGASAAGAEWGNEGRSQYIVVIVSH